MSGGANKLTWGLWGEAPAPGKTCPREGNLFLSYFWIFLTLKICEWGSHPVDPGIMGRGSGLGENMAKSFDLYGKQRSPGIMGRGSGLGDTDKGIGIE